MNHKKIHIGKLIQTFVKENNINSAELARKIGKTRQNVYDLYKRDDIEVKLFLTISEVLNHNFFEDIYSQKNDQHTIDMVFDVLKQLVKENIS
ncbi:MAG: hypothetical protein FWD60_01685 [Candidatus Azobacteroides sp.]|nr:hypothetical protein [Candidatus Azobacteroides sp.]